MRVPGLAIATAVLSLSSAAHAIEIRQYDKMASDDQAEYVADLIQGAEQALTDEGKPDLAAQVSKLFTTKLGKDKISIGSAEFNLNLASARVADAQRAAQDPNAHRLAVEDAMLVTLQKNNVPMSRDFVLAFRAINSNFQPKSPPR